jgi:hypothetical protein
MEPQSLLRTFTRPSTAQRKATQNAKLASLQSSGKEVYHKKHQRSFHDKETPTHYDPTKPGVGAEVLSYCLNKSNSFRLTEQFALLSEFSQDTSEYLHSTSPLLIDIGNSLLCGRACGYALI